MSWAIGYDTRWQRDVGYGVPAWCDHPGCEAEIDRGLSYVCGNEPYGGDHECEAILELSKKRFEFIYLPNQRAHARVAERARRTARC